MKAARNRNLGKSVVVVGITAAISQLLSVGYLVFLAHWVGPETYGIHAGIFNLCMISVFLVGWGLDTWLLKETSEDPASSTAIQLHFSDKVELNICERTGKLIAGSILLLKENPALLEKIGHIARQSFVDHYSIAALGKTFREHLESLLLCK